MMKSRALSCTGVLKSAGTGVPQSADTGVRQYVGTVRLLAQQEGSQEGDGGLVTGGQ